MFISSSTDFCHSQTDICLGTKSLKDFISAEKPCDNELTVAKASDNRLDGEREQLWLGWLRDDDGS